MSLIMNPMGHMGSHDQGTGGREMRTDCLILKFQLNSTTTNIQQQKISALKVTGDRSDHRSIHQFLLTRQVAPVKQLFLLILKSNSKLAGYVRSEVIERIT